MSTENPNQTFPFSALIYTKHRKKLAKQIIHSYSTPSEDPDTANECNSDDNYVPVRKNTLKLEKIDLSLDSFGKQSCKILSK